MSIIHDALKKVEKDRSTVDDSILQTSASGSTFTTQHGFQKESKNKPFFHLPSPSLRKNLLGIDIGSSSIKLVQLSRSGGTCHLRDVGYTKIPYGSDESATTEALKILLKVHGLGGNRISSSIRNKSLTFSHLQLPKMPKTDLAEAVKWEVKKGIDFPENAIIDYVVIDEPMEEGKTKLSIIAFAVRKDEVMGHAQMLKDASLIPDAIDVTPMALLSAFDYNYGWEMDKRTAVIDIGASKTTMAILSKGSLRFARYIHLAGYDITKSIQDSDGSDFQTAEETKLRYSSGPTAPDVVKNAIKSFTEGISIEIRRSFTYYQAHHREGRVDNILLSGGGSNIKSLIEEIGSATGVATAIYDTMKGVEVKTFLPQGTEIGTLSPALVEAFGLALRREGE